MRWFQGLNWRRVAWVAITALILGGLSADPPPVKRGKGGGWVVLPQVQRRATFAHHAVVNDASGGIYLELDASMRDSLASMRVGPVALVVQAKVGLYLNPEVLATLAGGDDPLHISFVKAGVGVLEVRLVNDGGQWAVSVR